MKVAFWLSLTGIVYTYLGYAGWLWLRTRIRPRSVKQASYWPMVSVAMVVQNEERTLEAKLANFEELNYPPEKLEIIVVSDGSTDSTAALLSGSLSSRVRAKINPVAGGKASALSDALALAAGEVVVFTDARQRIEAEAVRLLMENFADLSIGCASGELMLGDQHGSEAREGLGLYWKIEKKIRELESESGSVVGATGAFYAVRKNLVVPPPAGTILDDVFIPMNVVRGGSRVVFDGRARAWDSSNLGSSREFHRKVRTLGGNYQLLQLAPWLLSPKNPILFEFVSHKLLRLFVPFALVFALFSSAFVPGAFYRASFWLQVLFYGLSLLALTHLRLGFLQRLADPAKTLVVLNAAALVAFLNFAVGRKVVWSR